MDVTIINYAGAWYVCNSGGAYLADKGVTATFHGKPFHAKGCLDVEAAQELAAKYNLTVTKVETEE